MVDGYSFFAPGIDTSALLAIPKQTVSPNGSPGELNEVEPPRGIPQSTESSQVLVVVVNGRM